MASIELHPDFKDFLKLLHFHKVEYLLVGGYAVGYHGYPRATGDMDIWIAVDDVNAEKTAGVLREFGLPQIEVTKELFLEKDKVIRLAARGDQKPDDLIITRRRDGTARAATGTPCLQ